jgi:hypothetical protein
MPRSCRRNRFAEAQSTDQIGIRLFCKIRCAVRVNDVSNFVARIGVQRQDPCGNDEGDEGRKYRLEDRSHYGHHCH